MIVAGYAHTWIVIDRSRIELYDGRMQTEPGTIDSVGGRIWSARMTVVGAMLLGGCVSRPLPVHDAASGHETETSGPTGATTGPDATDPGTSGAPTDPSTTSTTEPQPPAPPDLGPPPNAGDLCEPWAHPPTTGTSRGPICPPGGLAGPDTGIPIIEILYPHSGHTFPAGAQFPFIFNFEDDLCVRAVEVTINGQSFGAIELSPDDSLLPMSGIPPGEYVFGFAAIDQAGNRSDQQWTDVFVCAR